MTGHRNHSFRRTCKAELQRMLSEDCDHMIGRERTLFDNATAPFNDVLVLFGAGGLGRKTLAGLRRVGIEPLAFADNNPALWNSRIDGLQVLSPHEAAMRFGQSAAFVVTIWRAGGTHRFRDTKKQLLGLNCSRVASFAGLFWKYSEIFLPYYALGLPHEFCDQTALIERSFDLQGDDLSRREYLAQLRLRFYLDFDNLPSPDISNQYFPEDLFKLNNDEIVADCGAFDGDTIRSLLEKRLPAFKGKIIALEPDSLNLEHLHRYVSTLQHDMRERVAVLPNAVGARCESIRFEPTGTPSSIVDQTGSSQIDCVTLDDIATSVVPTFIKMDIEGAERQALMGAGRLIRENAPILAVSVYHRPDDLWRIPLLIDAMSGRYRYFLRSHNEEGWDLVCYAVPVDRLAERLK